MRYAFLRNYLFILFLHTDFRIYIYIFRLYIYIYMCVCVCVCVCVYSTPLHEQDATPQFLCRVLHRLLKHSDFFFSKTGCLIRTQDSSLPNYLPIPGWRIAGFIPFQRVLALREMQVVSSTV